MAYQTLKFSSEVKNQLLESTNQLRNNSVLVLGDIGLDEYVFGQVERISPEAPVPVLEVQSRELRLGLAGNVAQNLASLGGSVSLVSAVGDDLLGNEIETLLKNNLSSSTTKLFRLSGRKTIVKSRLMSGHHHLLRLDTEDKRALPANVEEDMWASIEKILPQVKAVLIEDYAKGLLSRSLVERIFSVCRKLKITTFVDPNRHNPLDLYKGCDVFKPNWDEACALLGLSNQSKPLSPEEVTDQLQKRLQCHTVVVTKGREGLYALHKNQLVHVPTQAREVFDVTGAGDTVIATLTLALSAGLPLQTSAWLANFAAGYVVGQVGSVPCSLETLKSFISSTQNL